MKKRAFFFVIILKLSVLISCSKNQDYFSANEGKTIFYEIIFIDKEKKQKIFRQSLYFSPQLEEIHPVIKNDGEIIFYFKNDKGISKIKPDLSVLNFKKLPKNDDQSQLILAFPIIAGTEWVTNDRTTLQMKLGYDRVYDSDLPLNVNYRIISTNETISINGKKIKNCIKISGYGKTSFNPGPPLGNINIEVLSKTWISLDLGIVKYKREEISDSETMGKISYEKTILVDP